MAHYRYRYISISFYQVFFWKKANQKSTISRKPMIVRSFFASISYLANSRSPEFVYLKLFIWFCCRSLMNWQNWDLGGDNIWNVVFQWRSSNCGSIKKVAIRPIKNNLFRPDIFLPFFWYGLLTCLTTHLRGWMTHHIEYRITECKAHARNHCLRIHFHIHFYFLFYV